MDDITSKDPIDVAIELVNGLDGTMGKTDAEVAAQLREQEHPEPVNPVVLADLIDALRHLRLGRHREPEGTPDPLPRAIAAHWGEGTVTSVQAAVQAQIDHLIRLTDQLGIDLDSHTGQQIAAERRRLACAKLALNAVPLARTRLAAERIGARVCLTCEQLIATDTRSGLWRASRDVFAPGDSCESHDRRHTPEDAECGHL